MIRTATVVFGLALVSSSAFASQESYSFDPSHTEIGFSYDHMGTSTTSGRFDTFDGMLVLDRNDLANSRIDVTIETASLDTNWGKRDEHLTSPDFFDSATHPNITFKSNEVVVTDQNMAEVTGDLTIKGTTKPVTLLVTLNGEGESPVAPDTYVIGFEATTTILRSDFGVDMFAPFVSDEVEISISTELHRQ